MSAPSLTQHPSADADLIALCAKFEAAWKESGRLGGLDLSDATEAKIDAIGDVITDLLAKITATPATTLEGLKAKGGRRRRVAMERLRASRRRTRQADA